jgi:ribosomal protein L31E
MSDTAEKLIRMADQILRNLPPSEKRADQVADHIRRFWTAKMRADLAIAVQGKELDPVLAAALKQL